MKNTGRRAGAKLSISEPDRFGIFHKRRRGFHNNFSIIQLGRPGKPNFTAVGPSAVKKAFVHVLEGNSSGRRRARQCSARTLDPV